MTATPIAIDQTKLSLTLHTRAGDAVDFGVVTRVDKTLYFARYLGKVYVGTSSQTPSLIAPDGKTVVADNMVGTALHDVILFLVDGKGTPPYAGCVPAFAIEHGGSALRLRVHIRNPFPLLQPSDGLIQQDLILFAFDV
jgi:hypothetical protein